jgi:DNA polymerase-1
MRGLFQGNLVVGDYAQIEPRLMAHYSQDVALLDIYLNGKDIYLETARRIFGPQVEADGPERALCKTLVLAMGYGAYEKKLATILTINGHPTDVFTAKQYLKELTSIYSGFFGWKDAVIAAVKARGYVETIGGTHRRLKASFEDKRNWKNIGYGERQAVNAIIQGSAADIIRRVMVRGSWQHEQVLLAQVHDELVWEWRSSTGPPNEAQLEYIGRVGADQHGFQLSVPLVFEPHFGHSWFAAKEGLVEGLDEEETDED